jgi:nitronate monooxygenase
VLTTRFTELVGCSAPIQQAGMGSHANPGLAAAVANAGGLGMISVYSKYGGPPANVAKMLAYTRSQTEGVFGANFIMSFVDPNLADETVRTAAQHANVVEFFYTEPDPALIEIVHDEGALACWQIGSRDEALAAVDAGCDFIIAQGIEAGGHIRGRIGSLVLLDQVLKTVNVPVLAAGGISSGRALAAALAAGADGARVGTRFLATEEAETHPEYLQALVAAEAEDTVVTEAYDLGFPNAPHRVMRSCLEAASATSDEVVGTMADGWNKERVEMHRFEPDAVHKSATGNVAAMSMYAGESVSGVRGAQSVAEIIDELMSEAEMLLSAVDSH